MGDRSFTHCLDAVNKYGDAEREFGKIAAERPVTEEDREKVRLCKIELLGKLSELFD